MFGPCRGRGGRLDKSDAELVAALAELHSAAHWVGRPAETGQVEPDTATRLDPNCPECKVVRIAVQKLN